MQKSLKLSSPLIAALACLHPDKKTKLYLSKRLGL